MKKDIFNGKVKDGYRKEARNKIIIPCVLVFVVMTPLLLLAILYDEIQYGSRMVLFGICGLGYLYAVAYPIIAILCIRKYPKYRKLTRFIIGDDGFLGSADDSDGEYTAVTLNINARLQPIARGEFEENIDWVLNERDIGSVGGGGTMLSKGNGPLNCDVEIDCRPEKLDELKELFSTLPLPKGSRLIFADESEADIPLGDLDGIGVYLNGTDLSSEVYEKSDINVIIDDLIKAMESEVVLFDYWQGDRETALYFYGKSFDAMKADIEAYAATCPLFEKSRIESLCD